MRAVEAVSSVNDPPRTLTILSRRSEELFRKHTKHALHYGFDYRQAHFTILDNSRSEQLSPEELTFLESDLKTHAAQPVKFVISHRPSWLVEVIFKNRNLALYQLAKKYGVQYVIAGHVHQMLHTDLDGVTYIFCHCRSISSSRISAPANNTKTAGFSVMPW